MRTLAGFLLSPLLISAALAATAAEYSGLVWKRQGDWHLNGDSAVLRLGESIPQGGLITATGPGPHSLVILVPDGQRLLFECYESRTCGQGFRVPTIVSPPSKTAWAMFSGVRDVLLMRPNSADLPFPLPMGRDEDAANMELIAAPVAGNVSIAPALRVLPAGSYKLVTHTDRPQTGPPAALPEQSLEWDPVQGKATVTVADPGIYRIAVVDRNHVPRIELELLAVEPGQVAAETDGLKQTRSTVIAWNKTHEGWSLHDFLRAYLQSRAVALTQ